MKHSWEKTSIHKVNLRRVAYIIVIRNKGVEEGLDHILFILIDGELKVISLLTYYI